MQERVKSCFHLITELYAVVLVFLKIAKSKTFYWGRKRYVHCQHLKQDYVPTVARQRNKGIKICGFGNSECLATTYKSYMSQFGSETTQHGLHQRVILQQQQAPDYPRHLENQ